MVARSFGQVEAYLTVREVLPEASTGADGVIWREFSGFGRFRFATLGLSKGMAHGVGYIVSGSNGESPSAWLFQNPPAALVV